MATTRIMPLHVGKGRTESRAISDIIDYVANPQKTDNGKLITGYACDSRKEKAEEGAAKKRRSSLRKWSIYPCYESLESWVRISFTPSHSCSCRWDISSKSAL